MNWRLQLVKRPKSQWNFTLDTLDAKTSRALLIPNLMTIWPFLRRAIRMERKETIGYWILWFVWTFRDRWVQDWPEIEKDIDWSCANKPLKCSFRNLDRLMLSDWSFLTIMHKLWLLANKKVIYAPSMSLQLLMAFDHVEEPLWRQGLINPIEFSLNIFRSRIMWKEAQRHRTELLWWLMLEITQFKMPKNLFRKFPIQKEFTQR